MSSASLDASAEIPAAQDETQEQSLEEPVEMISWLEHRVLTRRCVCKRCTYTRPRIVEMPDGYECFMMDGFKRCRQTFASNDLLVVHQLECHRSIYPICPKQCLNMLNHVDVSRARPPPTVFMFQQWEFPICRPDINIDVGEEQERVKRAYKMKKLTRKRTVDGMVKMKSWHKEPESVMYDVFLEACARWDSGDEYERIAQHEEAMEFYERSKEHPCRTPSSEYPLVGHGRNWFKE